MGWCTIIRNLRFSFNLERSCEWNAIIAVDQYS